MKTQLEEVNEALAAGYYALRQISVVEGHLDSAKGWGYFDLFSRGGFLTSILKHSKLQDAENAMQQLAYTINRFNSELSDIKISNNVGQLTMSSGMQFADWFFDGLFVDAMTLSHIGESQRQVEDLRFQVQQAVDKLNTLKSALEGQNY